MRKSFMGWALVASICVAIVAVAVAPAVWPVALAMFDVAVSFVASPTVALLALAAIALFAVIGWRSTPAAAVPPLDHPAMFGAVRRLA